LLAQRTLEAFCATLADRTPTPGGGSVAALLAGLGTGLGAMVCRFSTGEKFAAVSASMEAGARRLDELRALAIPLVDRDAAAYDDVSKALALPKSSEAEKAARKAAMREALLGAMAIPLETMQVAGSALAVLAPVAPSVNRNVASDLDGAGRCLLAAAEIAASNVRVNALSIGDDPRAKEGLGRAERLLAEARARGEAVGRAAQTHLGPS
jgi:methenyltetrahydrofolate cyclohydrolase